MTEIEELKLKLADLYLVLESAQNQFNQVHKELINKMRLNGKQEVTNDGE